MPRCPEKRKAYLETYREANRERLRAEARERMAKVPKEVKAERARAWRATNKGRQAKAREHYARAVAKGFAGSFADWASQQCVGRALAAAANARMAHVSLLRLPRHMSDEARRYAEALEYRTRYWRDAEFRRAECDRTYSKKHPEFGCITTALRNGMRYGITRGTRVDRLYNLLGYTPQDLMRHLAARFDTDMSWRAFWDGEIHIDHVLPLCQFDITNPAELRESSQLRNLQPLWALDNLTKAARVA